MSTSLVLSGKPTEQSRIESLQGELYARNRQLNEAEKRILDLEQELRETKLQNSQLERGVSSLRKTLTPLYQGLQLVFGEMEGLGSVDEPSAVSPAKSPVWDSWKQKLGGKSAEAIDVLMMHGELNADQLRIHLHCARTHVYNVISQLNKAGVIIKNGGKISLKKL